MKKIKLTKYERRLEDEMMQGEWKPVSKEEAERIAAIIKAYRKDFTS